MMDALTLAFSFQGKLLGIEWHVWKVIGWLGNICFFSRFMVQWYATERRQQVVIPVAFWWLSVFGSLLLLSYALAYKRDSVFIFANAFNWIPYLRNLVIHHRHARNARSCPQCSTQSAPKARFCSHCGLQLSETEPAKG